MTSPVQSLPASSRIMTKSASPEFGLSVDKKQTQGNVIYLFQEAHREIALAKGFISADDLLKGLIDSDEDVKIVKQARKQIAKDFYSDEISLAAIRLSKGYSQRDLARKADTTQAYIARIESGKTDPGRQIMLKLCNALNIDMNQLNEALG